MEIFGWKLDSSTILILAASVLLGLIYLAALQRTMRRLRIGLTVQEAIKGEISNNPKLKKDWKDFADRINGMSLDKYYRFGKLLLSENQSITVANIMMVSSLLKIRNSKWLSRITY